MLIITFHNDSTGNDEIGNYNVEVCINTRILWRTRIENHNRKKGWQELINTLNKEIKRKQ